jgi:hypothetical protein
LARLAIFAMVARLQPVAACIELHDCLALSMRANGSVALCVLWAPFVQALCLGLGLTLHLPTAAVVVILAGDRREPKTNQ